MNELSMIDLDKLELESPEQIEVLSSRDIAIIGISINFPMGNHVDTYWNNLKQGINSVGSIPERRKKDVKQYLRAIGHENDKIKYQEMGYLNRIDTFDYQFFNISPKEASLMDPNQRLFLECAWKAIEDAGYSKSMLSGSETGVYVGYSANELYDYKRLIASLEPSSASIATTGNIIPIIASRISYLLNLNGPSMMVDTACSSSLVAVHLACQGIRSGDSNMAIAGGIKLNLAPIKKEQTLGIESSDGLTRTFDDGSDGTIISEGVAAILLKPLAKAKLDGDNIYAVIKGSAMNQDGHSMGITAPNALAQAKVLEKSWKDARIDPTTISYIEAHGTGTKLGDPIEIKGIEKAFSKYTSKKQFCAIGSVKSNMGHLDCAAGIAGLIKAVLALKHGEIPPSIHMKKPNKKIRFHQSPVFVNDVLKKWVNDAGPRRCGVSSFGISGTNCHIVLEEAPVMQQKNNIATQRPYILALSAKTEEALDQLLKMYLIKIREGHMHSLMDSCFTANCCREHYSKRVAIIAYNLQQMEEKLAYLTGKHRAGNQKDIFDNRGQSIVEDRGESSKFHQLIHDFIEADKKDKEILAQLANKYIEGSDIPWRLIYRDCEVKRVSLPTYPFNPVRCWLEGKEIEQGHQVNDMIYAPRWKPQLFSIEDREKNRSPIVILHENHSESDTLRRVLMENEREIILFNIERYWKNSDQFINVIKTIQEKEIEQIIYLPSEKKEICIRSGIQTTSVLNLLSFVKLLGKIGINKKIDMIVMAKYVNEVLEDQKIINPIHGSLFALGKVISLEMPLIKCKCVDMDDDTDYRTILPDINLNSMDYVIAYRNNQRYVEEIDRVDRYNYSNEPINIREGGVYIITGGTGLLGSQISEYLSQKGQVIIALIGRSFLPLHENRHNVDKNIQEKINMIKRIEANGAKVEYYTADVTKLDEMTKVIVDLKNKYGHINGVVHCAGIGLTDEEGTIENLSYNEVNEMIAPKIIGTQILDYVTHKEELDFYVTISSITTLLGGRGVGSYVIANAFLDHYSAYRNKQGKRTITVNIPVFESTYEKYKTLESNKEMVESFYNKQLFKILSKEDLNSVFNKAIQSNLSRVIVGDLNLESDIFYMLDNLPFRFSDCVSQDIKKKRHHHIEGKDKHIIEKHHKKIKLKGRDKGVYSTVEMQIGEIWNGVLGYEVINIFDNFYELGGDSIAIMKVINHINDAFQIEVTFREFIERNTIATLAEIVNKKLHTEQVSTQKTIYPKIHPDKENIGNPFPLTDVQMAYFIGRNEMFEMGGISTHAYTELETIMDIKQFSLALNKVIKRHPMLRAIVEQNGQQRILQSVPEYEVQVTDISKYDSATQEKYIQKKREEMSHAIFQTDCWPLFDFKAFRINKNKHYLFIGFDILIADGASMDIIVKEIIDMYTNPYEEIDSIQCSFRDYILAYKAFKNTKVYASDKDYWLNKLTDFPNAPSIPLKHDPAKLKKPHFRRLHHSIDKEMWDLIKKKAGKENVSPSALLCTLFADVLSIWSNQQDLGLNLTVFNRLPFHQDIERVIGDFTSIILLGLNLKQKQLWDKARYVQKVLLEGLEHRHYDGIECIRELSKQRSLENKSVMPFIFTSMLFNSDEKANSKIEQFIEVKMRLTQTPQVYLDHQVSETNGHLELNWDYVEELFDVAMLNDMFSQYIAMLMAVVSGESTQTHHNRELINQIKDYNATDTYIEEATLHGLFINQMKLTPKKIAVQYEGQHITYEELQKKSNQVTNYLINKGVNKNETVGLITDRRIETIVNIMGILKAGAAYVPIEPDYPQERKTYICNNSGCKLLLDADSYIMDKIYNYKDEDVNINLNPNSIAYIIHTSGSTGKPKGVIIKHLAASNTIQDINQRFNVTQNDRILGVSSMSFDLSVYDIFGALSTGATLVMVKDQRDVRDLVNKVVSEKITIWNSVPAIMNLTTEKINFMSNCLRLVLLSGDWIPLNLPDRIIEHFPCSQVISLGGATEASIWSIWYPIKHIHKKWKSIPYGYPLANQQIYILNYRMEPCPIGVQGEIYIGGKGVAEGYLNNENKTKESFIFHDKYAKLYKTGDFGILHKDGYIEFLGRKDTQVKIKGYRIELGEIESCLLEEPHIHNAVVIDRTDDTGKKYLCAYVIYDGEMVYKEIRQFLSKRLPEYMIPIHAMQVNTIPLSQNGKVDRKALPEPIKTNMVYNYMAPTNEVENKLAKIWQGILQVEKVGIYDSFFELGGDSFLLIRMHQRIEEEFSNKLQIVNIFNNPTISKLSQFIVGEKDKRAKVKKQKMDEASLEDIFDCTEKGILDIDEAVQRIKRLGEANG